MASVSPDASVDSEPESDVSDIIKCSDSDSDEQLGIQPYHVYQFELDIAVQAPIIQNMVGVVRRNRVGTATRFVV